MQFYNRLTGQTQKDTPDYLLMGQWQLLPESTETATATVNGVTVSPQSTLYVSPDATKCFRAHLQGGALNEGTFPSWQLPSDLLLESLQHFSSVLNEVSAQSEFWDKWTKTLPLVHDIEENISPQPLEELLRKHIGHLEEICHHPRTYLKMETERLPISRAQRISPHATDFLAAHTEDWEKRTFRGIRPKRILCLIREDLLDIYENRVTAQLVEHLLEYLKRRINDVEDLKRELEEADNFSRDIYQIYWRNEIRICSLWGEQFKAATTLAIAEETLKLLKQLRYKLKSLLDTDLYRAIPPQASVGNTLKRTNILINDQHYRYVDRLWHAWAPWKRGHTQTPQQFLESYQRSFRGFEAFCFLIVSRALTGSTKTNDKGLGFEFENLLSSKPLLSVELSSARGSITLRQQSDGVILLKADGIKPLRLIPLLLPLTATTDVNIISEVYEKLSLSFANNKDTIPVILYLGNEENRKALPELIRRKIDSLENIHNGKGEKLVLLPVSPLDIFSVERVARAIQWWFYSQYCQIYPFIIQKRIPETLLSENSWLLQIGNQIVLHRPPLPKEQDDFGKKLSVLIRQVVSLGPQAKGKLGELKELNRLPCEAKEHFRPLLACPTCHKETNSFESLDGQRFRCYCQGNEGCGTEWGVRICNQCSQHYPYIQLSDSDIHSLSEALQTDLVERIFGRNVLASPNINNRKENSFRCPNCGFCN